MSNVAESVWKDEDPTCPTGHVPSTLLAFAIRVDRLASLALERLRAGDENGASDATSAIIQLKALTAGVIR